VLLLTTHILVYSAYFLYQMSQIKKKVAAAPVTKSYVSDLSALLQEENAAGRKNTMT